MIPLVLLPDLSRHYPDSSQLAELTVQIAYSIKSFKITDIVGCLTDGSNIFFYKEECRKAEEYGLKIDNLWITNTGADPGLTVGGCWSG